MFYLYKASYNGFNLFFLTIAYICCSTVQYKKAKERHVELKLKNLF